jgi:REP element-mobilizing transposase RayT
MARRKRFHLPGAVYHVMLRGNQGQDIFYSDGDRCRMSLLLQEGVERFHHKIIAYCFMSNHIHLAVQVVEENISVIMQNLAFRYAAYVNRHQNRVGHLFQGRFRAIIIDSSTYLKALVKYIHLNPVRARIVACPDQYRWSSHQVYLKCSELAWISSDYLLRGFDNNLDEAVAVYKQYINDTDSGKDVDFKIGFRSGILGDNDFIEACMQKTTFAIDKPIIDLRKLISVICSHYQMEESALRSQSKSRYESRARAVFALLARDSGVISINEVAQYLGRDPSGVSKLARRLEESHLNSQSVLVSEINNLKILLKAQMSECPV